MLNIENTILVLEVLAEGGAIRLLEHREALGTYSVLLNDQCLLMIDEGDAIEHRTDVADWSSALRAMDRYPWRKLCPEYVAPAYAARIFDLVLDQGESLRAGRLADWSRCCGVNLK